MSPAKGTPKGEPAPEPVAAAPAPAPEPGPPPVMPDAPPQADGPDPTELSITFTPRQILGGFALLAGLVMLLRRRGRPAGSGDRRAAGAGDRRDRG